MSEIFFSPINSVLSNKAAGTIVVGQSGAGKTFCLVNIAASALEQGCNIFALDAKNDMLALRNLYPGIKVTDVNKIAPGSLDPFLIFHEVDTTMILTIVEIICGKLSTEQKLAVTPIIGDFVNKAKLTHTANFRDFANYLYQNQNPAAQAVGNQLLINANTQYGPILFGEPGVRSRGIMVGRESRIISIFGMPLPTGTSTPRADEMLSSAIVYIICCMLRNILTRKNVNKKQKGAEQEKKRPALLIFDECHILMRSNEIKDIIDELLVLGRSLNVGVIAASQNVTHFDEKLAQHFSSKFTFKMSKREAAEFFELFNNTTTENELDISECIEVTTRLKSGYCFFIDNKERCTLIHIVSPYDTGDITSNPLFKKR